MRCHNYAASIHQAVASNGYLMCGHGAITLHYRCKHGHYTRLSGVPESFKTQCIDAGLPVVDMRTVPWEDAKRIAINGPMIAEPGNAPDDPPYRPLSYAPRSYVFDLWAAVGAEIYNAG